MGPVKVVKRVGEFDYQVLIREGVIHDVHQDQMKGYVEGVEGEPLELFHFQPKYAPQETEVGTWNVERILKHKHGKNGEWLFLTKWEGADESESTWEPAGNFITRYCAEFIRYLKEQGLHVDMSESLRGEVGERGLETSALEE